MSEYVCLPYIHSDDMSETMLSELCVCVRLDAKQNDCQNGSQKMPDRMPHKISKQMPNRMQEDARKSAKQKGIKNARQNVKAYAGKKVRMLMYVDAIYTSKWSVRNYVRIVLFQVGDHSKKVGFYCSSRFQRLRFPLNTLSKVSSYCDM